MMHLRAATKPTDANSVRVIKKKVQSIKAVTNDYIYRQSLSLAYSSFPFETSLPAPSCIYLQIIEEDQQKLQAELSL